MGIFDIKVYLLLFVVIFRKPRKFLRSFTIFIIPHILICERKRDKFLIVTPLSFSGIYSGETRPNEVVV